MKTSNFLIQIDPLLIQAARQGKMHACEQIYRQFEKPVYNLAWRIAQNSADAQDILQETFIRLFQRLHQYREQAPFGIWLRQIALSITLQHLRKRRRHQQQNARLQQLSAHEPWHHEPLEIQENTLLLQAFAQLPVETRAVVWLYHAEDLTHQEIANITGKTVSYSKSQLSRAHAQLRIALQHTKVETP